MCTKAHPDAHGDWSTGEGKSTAQCVRKSDATQGLSRVYRFVDSVRAADEIWHRVFAGTYSTPPQYPAPGSVKPICELDQSFKDNYALANFVYIDRYWPGPPHQFVTTGWFALLGGIVQFCAIGLHDNPNS